MNMSRKIGSLRIDYLPWEGAVDILVSFIVVFCFAMCKIINTIFGLG